GRGEVERDATVQPPHTAAIRGVEDSTLPPTPHNSTAPVPLFYCPTVPRDTPYCLSTLSTAGLPCRRVNTSVVALGPLGFSFFRHCSGTMSRPRFLISSVPTSSAASSARNARSSTGNTFRTR